MAEPVPLRLPDAATHEISVGFNAMVRAGGTAYCLGPSLRRLSALCLSKSCSA
jgi:hypothetical protein